MVWCINTFAKAKPNNKCSNAMKLLLENSMAAKISIFLLTSFGVIDDMLVNYDAIECSSFARWYKLIQNCDFFQLDFVTTSTKIKYFRTLIGR